MKAIVVTDQAAGTAGMKLVERPEPQGAALAGLSGASAGSGQTAPPYLTEGWYCCAEPGPEQLETV